MTPRDRLEEIMRSWNAYEISQDKTPIIDYDLLPGKYEPSPSDGRIEVLGQLTELRGPIQEYGDTELLARMDAESAYLRALLGERLPVDSYVQLTQGCPAVGWTTSYIDEQGERVKTRLESLGIKWDRSLRRTLETLEGQVAVDDAPDAIRLAANELDQLVRAETGATAEYSLDVSIVDEDAYWSYWIDGSGQKSRLRINMRNARFTSVTVRQFALHEILGHALQYACYAARVNSEDVPWIRLLTVHSPSQVLLEGLAQALPLLIVPDDAELRTRVMFDHYQQLVFGELHLAINSGLPILDCIARARARAPFWPDSTIERALADRSTSPQLRSYLWAYTAGIDWFTALSYASTDLIREVLHAAYCAPLSPRDLRELWPTGPAIGGNREPVRLRQSTLPDSA